jgi:hypothetical protein
MRAPRTVPGGQRKPPGRQLHVLPPREGFGTPEVSEDGLIEGSRKDFPKERLLWVLKNE